MFSLIVVEDDESVRSGLVNLFPWEESGFTVVADFSGGTPAWEYLKDHPETHAVLTDIRMPSMDGLQLTQLICENCPSIQVVLISGYRDFAYAQEAIRYGVRDFLVKPIKHSALILTFLKLKEELEKHAPTQEKSTTGNYYSKVTQAVKAYITNNLRTATLEEAAVLVHLSSGHLSRVFKASAGISLSDYLLKKRMEKALVLLKDFNYKVYEIAFELGYDSPKNFTRAFRNFHQLSPREFRDNGGILP